MWGVTRDRRGRDTRERPEGHGSVTEVGPRHGDRGKSTLPRVLSNSHDRAVDFEPPTRALKSTARYRALISALKTDPGRPEERRSRHLRHRSWRDVAERRALPGNSRAGPRVSPTSGRTCDRCFKTPSRPGRLMGVTACQDPHETPRTDLGRAGGPEARASPGSPASPPPPSSQKGPLCDPKCELLSASASPPGTRPRSRRPSSRRGARGRRRPRSRPARRPRCGGIAPCPAKPGRRRER